MGKLFSRAVGCIIWTMCAFILTASVDAIPDPPAVNTQRVEVKAECDCSPLKDLSLKTQCSFVAPTFVLHWISDHQIFDAQCIWDRIELVQQAADPSPPSSHV